MNNHLKKIKISFSIIILLLIVGITGSGFAINNNNFFIMKRLSQTINYLIYKSSFVYTNNKNLIAAVISIFDDTNLVIKNNNDIAKSIPVLLYHGVIDEQDGANVLLKNFRDQMFALKKAGWQTISIEDFYKFMEEKKELPDKSFLLTFDDGRKDNYYPVDPILKALNYNAVIFVITKYSLEDKSGNYYLSKKELERMTESGRWKIEAHAREGHNFYKIAQDGKLGHFYSNKLWLDNENRPETNEEFINRIKSDFTITKNDIEQGLNSKVISFAFPFGDFGQNSVNFPEAEPIILDATKSIYSMAFYQVWPDRGFSFNYPNNNEFLIKRINVEPNWTPDALVTLLDASKEKPLPYFEDFKKYSGWNKTWGRLTLEDSSMIIGATDSNNGSFIFLDGSYLWKNYIFKADVYSTKGEVFSLIARYKNSKNYITCSFSNRSIRVEQFLNGERKILSERRDNFIFIGINREVGIGINDNFVNCYLDGKIAMKVYNLDKSLDHGGIGFKTWDSQINNSELIIKSVSIK